MHKLTLKLEDLQVDTFVTVPPKEAKGTVFGEQCTCYTACTCPGCPSCEVTCGSCVNSCQGGTGCESCAACPHAN
jgi:hypothetical protein